MMLTGKAFYARITGAPHKNKFNPEVDQWSFELSVDQENADKLLSAGMKPSYLRNKNDERGTFITFSRDAMKKDGTEGKPYTVVDSKKEPWDPSVKIGNGSVLNVITSLNERTFRGEKFLKPGAIQIQVWEHSPYEGKTEFDVKDGEDASSEKDW